MCSSITSLNLTISPTTRKRKSNSATMSKSKWIRWKLCRKLAQRVMKRVWITRNSLSRGKFYKIAPRETQISASPSTSAKTTLNRYLRLRKKMVKPIPVNWMKLSISRCFSGSDSNPSRWIKWSVVAKQTPAPSYKTLIFKVSMCLTANSRINSKSMLPTNRWGRHQTNCSQLCGQGVVEPLRRATTWTWLKTSCLPAHSIEPSRRLSKSRCSTAFKWRATWRKRKPRGKPITDLPRQLQVAICTRRKNPPRASKSSILGKCSEACLTLMRS